MNRPQKYTAFKFGWDCVAQHLSGLISEILGREVNCQAKQEDYDYWCAFTEEESFTIVEIATLIGNVNGDKELYAHLLPTDSNTSRSLSMELCQVLLRKALNADWVEELVREDTLWIIGDFPEEQNVTFDIKEVVFDASQVRNN